MVSDFIDRCITFDNRRSNSTSRPNRCSEQTVENNWLTVRAQRYPNTLGSVNTVHTVYTAGAGKRVNEVKLGSSQDKSTRALSVNESAVESVPSVCTSPSIDTNSCLFRSLTTLCLFESISLLFH